MNSIHFQNNYYMESKTRIRINLNTREIELEGSESSIEKYDDIIKEFIEKFKSTQPLKLLKAFETYPKPTEYVSALGK